MYLNLKTKNWNILTYLLFYKNQPVIWWFITNLENNKLSFYNIEQLKPINWKINYEINSFKLFISNINEEILNKIFNKNTDINKYDWISSEDKKELLKQYLSWLDISFKEESPKNNLKQNNPQDLLDVETFLESLKNNKMQTGKPFLDAGHERQVYWPFYYKTWNTKVVVKTLFWNQDWESNTNPNLQEIKNYKIIKSLKLENLFARISDLSDSNFLIMEYVNPQCIVHSNNKYRFLPEYESFKQIWCNQDILDLCSIADWAINEPLSCLIERSKHQFRNDNYFFKLYKQWKLNNRKLDCLFLDAFTEYNFWLNSQWNLVSIDYSVSEKDCEEFFPKKVLKIY